MLKRILSFVFLAALVLLSGCHRKAMYKGDTCSLEGLKSMSAPKSLKKQQRHASSHIREMGLRETALSVGAQAGLAWRANTIDQALTLQARRLDAVFDFNSLILQHNILPPVLLEGRNTLNLADTQTIRISDRTYKLMKQARFVTTPPNWRQYLWMDYKKPEHPHESLLARTRQERKRWCYYVAKGWKDGIEQADIILEENIARIKEDYHGMILYRKLLAMNMVSSPYVSETELGITGDEAEMHIDDRVLRITALPMLNINSQEWRAAVAQDENALEKFKAMEARAQNTKIVITDKTWQPVIAPVNR